MGHHRHLSGSYVPFYDIHLFFQFRMAKGKGKGRGRGKGDDDCCSGCCCCICCCLFFPPLLMLIGVLMILSKNTRVERIEEYPLIMMLKLRYNARAKIWKETGLNSFKNISFYLANKSNKFEPVTATSGQYYPTRDSCEKDGDPAEGCLTTDALYYRFSAKLPSTTTTRVIVYGPTNELIVDDEYKNGYVNTYTASQLDCKDDLSKCYSKCSSKGGTWDQYRKVCSVSYYLIGFCYRVNKVNNKWQLDIPA